MHIAVYGVFFYCPSDHTHDSPFAANLASLPCLPINTSYASSTSINISGKNYPTTYLQYLCGWVRCLTGYIDCLYSCLDIPTGYIDSQSGYSDCLSAIVDSRSCRTDHKADSIVMCLVVNRIVWLSKLSVWASKHIFAWWTISKVSLSRPSLQLSKRSVWKSKQSMIRLTIWMYRLSIQVPGVFFWLSR